MNDEAQDSPEARARRTEKQWRHEERELASTHAFWGALIGLHGAVAGLAGVLVGQKSFPASAFISIGVLSLVSMCCLALLNYLSRTADRRRAAYFAVTSQKKWPEGFASEYEDSLSRAAVRRYLHWQKPIEVVVMGLFLVNALMFGCGVMAGG